VTIWYLARLMSKPTITTYTVVTDLDPATLAELTTLENQRIRAHRLLLKRRRQKSGQ